MISETNIIHNYLKNLTFNNKSSLKLNDDVYYDVNKKIIFSTDTFEEGTHFVKSSNPNKFVKKIFRSAVSDILCKGSRPMVYFLSLSAPKITHKWLNSFCNELKKESKKYGLFLGGGDTVKSKKLSISISVIGETKTKPILRSTARKNDDIYVTGNLGDSFLGLVALKNKTFSIKFKKFFINLYEAPNLPLKFSKHIYKFATSSTDVSDGVIRDLENICSASKCGAKLFFSKIPFSKQALELSRTKKINLYKIFSKGDDYQILFTSNSKNRKLIKFISKKNNTKVSRIGVITSKNGVQMKNGDKIDNLSSIKSGYIHTF
ncbi:MAG: thiamine-monophosphate kinase [Pelagibacterales bacterium]|nr:thiamine-monophosphate kinase [Pelagibacterales bacterium]